MKHQLDQIDFLPAATVLCISNKTVYMFQQYSQAAQVSHGKVIFHVQRTNLKQNKDSRGNRRQKRNKLPSCQILNQHSFEIQSIPSVCLPICAVNIKVIYSLDTKSLINALWCFTARRQQKNKVCIKLKKRVGKTYKNCKERHNSTTRGVYPHMKKEKGKGFYCTQTPVILIHHIPLLWLLIADGFPW